MGYVLKKYADPKKFWSENCFELKKQEAKHNLILGLSYRFQSYAKECLYQAAMFVDDKLHAVLICSFNRGLNSLLIANVDHEILNPQLIDDFLSSNIKFHNLVGDLASVHQCKKILEQKGFKFKINMEQGIYCCHKVIIPPCKFTYKFLKATTHDLHVISQWIECFHLEAVPYESMFDALQMAKNKIEQELIYILEVGGEKVSMVGYSRDIGSSASVNLVFTPKNFRNNGYASLATALMTDHLLKTGRRETNLYTDLNNPTSNKIYQNIGYQFVCNSMSYGIVE